MTDGTDIQHQDDVKGSVHIQSGEKVFHQEDVNHLIGRAKASAYEKGKQDALLEIQKSNSDSGSNLGGMKQMSQAEIERLIEEKSSIKLKEEIQRIQQEAHNQAQYQQSMQIANEFLSKIEASKAEYPEIIEVLNDIDLSKIPEIVHLANSVDNTADVMMELYNNPSKMITFKELSHYSATKALKEMKKLSESIKEKKSAQSQPKIPEPLSQFKSSPVTLDNGEMTIRDLRKKYHV
jgi:hypothetical protein